VAPVCGLIGPGPWSAAPSRCPRDVLNRRAGPAERLARGWQLRAGRWRQEPPVGRSNSATARSQAKRSPTPTRRSTGLQLIEDGLPPERVIERVIASDAGRELRQLGIVDHEGRVAAYTGDRCIAWAGHLIGEGSVCLGNILKS
jgi:hypothetical protein